LFLPDWWLKGSIENHKKWHPTFGVISYLAFNCFFYAYTLICVFLLWSRIKKITTWVWMVIFELTEILFSYLLGNSITNRTFTVSLFYRLLSGVYLCAFGALIWQFELISETGLIPYKEFCKETYAHEGFIAILNYPSIFWLNQSNLFVYSILFISCLIALLGIVRKRPLLILHLWLWLCYLSVVSFGRDLFHFPWDPFLLEVGFISLLGAYFIEKYNSLPRIVLFAFLLLFFRQWFSMGITKLLYSDPRWYDLTFMKDYWLNIPSPTPLSPYLHILPISVQKILTLTTLIVELAIPTAMILGRRGRIAAFLMSFLLSIGIQLTGNFGFFNLLTAVLGLWCLDDSFFKINYTSRLSRFSIKRSVLTKMITLTTIIVVGFNVFYTSLQIFDKQAQKFESSFLNYYFVEKSFNPIYMLGVVVTKLKIVSPHGVFKGLSNGRLHMQIQTLNIKGEWSVLHFNKGKDILSYSFTAPIQNRLPFYFYYQAYGHNWLARLSKMYPSSAYINSALKNLLTGIFDNNQEIGKLIDIPEYKVLKIKLLREKIYCDKYGYVYTVPYDSIIIGSKKEIITPIPYKDYK
jgi:hypothetical protein